MLTLKHDSNKIIKDKNFLALSRANHKLRKSRHFDMKLQYFGWHVASSPIREKRWLLMLHGLKKGTELSGFGVIYGKHSILPRIPV